MWIVIFGTKKLHTGTQYLEFAQSGDKFEPGSVKTFSFDAPDVNEVKRIKVQTGLCCISDEFAIMYL